eukprot:TRINITY_DN3698_c0_g1_i2.p1 TRINITY_DN3698_c0_g1~~TRINITY_DN3698_c0_g1_i2.p1  ORF type:complete len:195 (-),score=60.76 TRINITY_DN3698_c0_g1_i2:22-606(-)
MEEEHSLGDQIPLEAKQMESILKSMGVQDYDPRVVNQLMELTHRYVSDLLKSSSIYSQHAGKIEVDLDDLKLASQARINRSFTQPPPRELILDFAKHKNSVSLPSIPRLGVVLPNEDLCLSARNYQVDPRKKAKKEVPQPLKSSLSKLPNEEENENDEENSTPMIVDSKEEAPEPGSMPKLLFNLAGINKQKYQ